VIRGLVMLKIVSSLLVMMCVGAAQAQQIYRWVDANGRVQYSAEKPPAGTQSSVVPPRVSAVPGQAVPAATASGGAKSPVAARPEVKMYATDWCGYCRQAREYFARNGIAFTELDIEKSAAANAEHKALGGKGVPLILVGKERMNGFSEPQMVQLLKRAGY
jgi:glutaredoxin